MSQPPPPVPLDARLTTLLEVEQRLEAGYRDAEGVARAQVAAAQEALQRAREEGLRTVEARWAEEVRADTEAHRVALAAVETERAAALAGLEALAQARIEALANTVLTRLLEVPGGA